MFDASSEQLFLQAAARIGMPAEDPAARKLLTDLFWEYMRMAGEVRVNEPFERNETVFYRITPAEWNDEDVDQEDEEQDKTVLTDWSVSDPEPEKDVAELVASGAAAYYSALQEVMLEAGRIRRELEENLSRGKVSNPEEYQALQKALLSVSAPKSGFTTEEMDAALASLEEIAYKCMVGTKKGFLGMMNATMQRMQELSKEGWALAGQAQVDLDLNDLPPEDPRSRINRTMPLRQQMQQEEQSVSAQHSGRLQRMIRFDDLQMDLKSQRKKRPPRNGC